MNVGQKVRAKRNPRVSAKTEGVVVDAPSYTPGWLWVRWQGHADAFMMKPSELEAISDYPDFTI